MASKLGSGIIQVTIAVLFLAIFGSLIVKYFFTDELDRVPVAAEAVVHEVNYRKAQYAYVDAPQVNASQVRGFAQQVPVLVYHGLTPDEYKSDVLAKDFQEQMFTLKRAGYETVAYDDFIAFLEGRKRLPDKSFLLTFDDGIRSSYTYADPVLRALNYTAVMFAITKYNLLDHHPYYLTKEEMQSMRDSGRWTIQAHAKHAHNLIPIAEDGSRGMFMSNLQWIGNESRFETEDEFRVRIRQDLLETKQEVADGFDTTVTSYTPPFGNYGHVDGNYRGAETVFWEEASQIYPYIFYQWWEGEGASANYPGMNRLKRIIIYKSTDVHDLLEKLEDARDKQLPYNDTFNSNRGWVVVWGDATISGGNFIMQSSPGSMTFLDGAQLFDAVEFTAQVQSGSNIGLMAQVKNHKNYVMCDFSPVAVRIRQVTNNQTTVAAMRSNAQEPYELRDGMVVGMRSANDEVACLLDGQELLSAPLPTAPGTVGFNIIERPGNTETVTIDSMYVEPVVFKDSFDHALDIAESSPTKSASRDWWVNSGGAFIIKDGIGMTVQGASSEWQGEYSLSNPGDTGQGQYPQHIFRLLTQTTWEDNDQSVRFQVRDYRAQDYPHRNESNGVLLFSRYVDEDNQYYAGIRVDGATVIKKKSEGVYHEIAYAKVLPGRYDRDTDPNLIPPDWMGLRLVTVTQADGSVKLSLYLDQGQGWQLVVDGVDDKETHGAEIYSGRNGIRTDFMDVAFDDYAARKMGAE